MTLSNGLNEAVTLNNIAVELLQQRNFKHAVITMQDAVSIYREDEDLTTMDFTMSSSRSTSLSDTNLSRRSFFITRTTATTTTRESKELILKAQKQLRKVPIQLLVGTKPFMINNSKKEKQRFIVSNGQTLLTSFHKAILERNMSSVPLCVALIIEEKHFISDIASYEYDVGSVLLLHNLAVSQLLLAETLYGSARRNLQERALDLFEMAFAIILPVADVFKMKLSEINKLGQDRILMAVLQINNKLRVQEELGKPPAETNESFRKFAYLKSLLYFTMAQTQKRVVAIDDGNTTHNNNTNSNRSLIGIVQGNQ